MNCRGLHCPGCHHSRPGGPITALLVLLAISAGARAVAHVLPILLHILIVTAITATTLTVIIATVVLTARRAARPERQARQPPWRVPAHVIQAAASHRRELPAPPGPPSLPAPAAVPDAAPPATPQRPTEGHHRYETAAPARLQPARDQAARVRHRGLGQPATQRPSLPPPHPQPEAAGLAKRDPAGGTGGRTVTTGREPNTSSAQQLSDANSQPGLLFLHAPEDQCEDLGQQASVPARTVTRRPTERCRQAHPPGEHDTERGRSDHDDRRAR
jgi:hypothetical protein